MPVGSVSPSLSVTPATPASTRPEQRRAVAARQPKDELKLAAAKKATAPAAQPDPKSNVGVRLRLTGFASIFSTALTTWLFDPNMLVAHIKAVSGQIYNLASGSRVVHGWARGFRVAAKEGTTKTYARGVARELGGFIKSNVKDAKDGVVGLFRRGAAPAAAEAAPAAATVVNKGLFGWFAAARAEGANPAVALLKAGKRTIETGGPMPQITAHAEAIGGWWGKTFAVAGKVARLAPLLNVPIAFLDVVNAYHVIKSPVVSERMRSAKIGQAVLSSSAAALSVAAFVLPGPLDMVAIRWASYAGFASVGWALLSSRPVYNLYARVANFLHLGHHQAED